MARVMVRKIATRRATWKPIRGEKHGRLDAADANALPTSAFAFPSSRKEPMTDPSHVRNALARFDQVQGVTDADRELAFLNIKKAARHFRVGIKETEWRQLGRKTVRSPK
jgi:Family of unknown function (DUF6582)